MTKKILILSALVIINFCFAQNMTKKYNSYYERYEYFNSSGNIVGYEKYNSYSRQWEYYDLGSKQTGAYQYRDPEKLDISSLGNAMSIKQGRYNNNVQLVQNIINEITNKINSLNISSSEKSTILSNFSDVISKNLSGKSFDYSSSNETNRIINWLYESSSKIIENVVNSQKTQNNYSANNNYQNKKPSSYEDHFNKKLNVYRIAKYDERSRKFLPDENIISSSYIILDNNNITFKNAKGETLYRDLSNKKYNSNKGGYDYTSNWGNIFIQENLMYVQFYSDDLSDEQSYTYFISN